MTPETALTEITRGIEVALMVGGPLLATVLVIGVVVGVIQAATQVNEPTIAFVSKALALVAAIGLLGSMLLTLLTGYATDLYQRIPHLIG